MTEFWESNFREKQEMWGFEPTSSVVYTAELMKDNGLKKLLIPGFGYGRNAQYFTEKGFDVTGIEISKTAIELARKHYGDNTKVYHGSVCDMPFDEEVYDTIFCHALIHLLDEKDRLKLIKNCYNQLRVGGYLVFVVISTNDKSYGIGEKLSHNRYRTKHGVNLFFYDEIAVEKEFGNYGLVSINEIQEPPKTIENKPSQLFWQITCKKGLEI
jgi:SAM-dependent methyltransferase